MSTPTVPPSILVVEDEPLIAEDLADLCTRAGYRVAGIAHGVDRALLLAERMRPALALVDVNLGESVDGVTLAERFQKDFGLPFVFVTSYVDRTTLERAGRLAPLGYIVKPFIPAQVTSAVEVALAQLGRFAPREFDAAALNRPGIPAVSDREAEVLGCIWRGLDTRGTARALFVSENTVKYHLKNLYGKFEVNTRVGLLRALQAAMRR